MTLNASDRMILFLTGKTSSERSRKDKAIKFSMKLMYVVQCGEYTDIIEWCPSGLAFVIMDPESFESRVLPEIFKEAKFSSFLRKLARWGFVKAKVNRGTKSRCFGHPQFRRGNFQLCKQMRMHNTPVVDQDQQRQRVPVGSPFGTCTSVDINHNNYMTNVIAAEMALVKTNSTSGTTASPPSRFLNNGLQIPADMKHGINYSGDQTFTTTSLRAAVTTKNYSSCTSCPFSGGQTLPWFGFNQSQRTTTTRPHVNQEPSMERRLANYQAAARCFMTRNKVSHQDYHCDHQIPHNNGALMDQHAQNNIKRNFFLNKSQFHMTKDQVDEVLSNALSALHRSK